MRGRLSGAAYCAALAIVASAPSTTQRAMAQQSRDVGQAKIEQGKATFAAKCSHCHGPNMVNSGTITPDLRRFPDDKERFVNTVKAGRNNRMPPWGDVLNDEEIAELWAYVSSQRKP